MCALGIVGAPCRAPYGLQPTAAVAPFLDGAFPSRRPQGDLQWGLAVAFPDLAGLPGTALVIATSPADDRIYHASIEGRIVSFANDPAATQLSEFMDLSDRVAVVSSGGFLGLVFHPEFGQAGSPHALTFYAYYSSFCPTDAAGSGIDWSACNPDYPYWVPTLGFYETWLRLSRFEAYWDPVEGVYKGDSTSESPMLNIRLYNDSHRGGGMVIDAGDRLLLTVGDQYRFASPQDIAANLEGKVLRMAIDVVETGGGAWSCPAGSHLPRRTMRAVTGNLDELSGRLYCIPDDNPWLDAGGSVFEEPYSIGHRNPHRMTQDRATGRLWSGEVGETSREEVNVILKGHNYGWPFREGKIAGPWPPPPQILGVLTDPVIDFTRDEAVAIIGGYVYRGSRFPELRGRYLAGDYGTDDVWAIDLDVATMTATKELLTTFPGGLSTWGEDEAGELLLGNVLWGAEPIYRLERVGSGVPDPPPYLSQLGAFDDLATLDPHDGAVPFEPVPFWSDGARKLRWAFVPSDGTRDQPDEKVGFSASGDWSFPLGTVLMKHFELQLDEDDPELTTRLETRFLVHGEDGWYGVTYRWEADQSDAHLLDAAETADYTIATAGGGTRLQTWTFPSRGDCAQCHNERVGGPAGPRTHALNHTFLYPSTGRSDNQLRDWNHVGLFAPALVESEISSYLAAPAADDPRDSLEQRARSYLDANCSNCHRPGVGNPAGFDARFATPLASQGLVWGAVADDLGIPGALLIRPGEPLASIVYQRAAALGPVAMPPLAKARVDEAGMAVLAAWIARIDPAYPAPGPNQPPMLAAPSSVTSAVGAVISLPLAASDPDGDPLYFSATGLPAGLAIDPWSGRIEGTLGDASLGAWTATVGVSDGPTAASREIRWLVE